MSFVVTSYVREGIVMAADSRLTLNLKTGQPGATTTMAAVSQSDSNQKLFLTENGVGISTVGDADIAGVPIAGFIAQFVDQIVSTNAWTPDKVADEIITFFNSTNKIPNSYFQVAGYDQSKNDQQVCYVEIQKKKKTRMNAPGQFGIAWAGESDTISKLANPCAEIDPSTNQIKQVYPNFPVPYQFFTLQDAIDFAEYAVRTTIDTMRFQPRPKSVGGPIDILVIKPNEQRWIRKKELSAR
jgi:hypothetical protein